MSEDLYFMKQIESLDNKIIDCINDITKLFGNIDNLDNDVELLISEKNDCNQFSKALKSVVDLIQKNPCLADYILPHLRELREQNCIELLDRPCSTAKKSCTEDGTKCGVQVQWELLCYSIEKYIFSYLKDIHIDYNTASYMSLCKLKTHINAFQTIYEPKLAYEMHKSLRNSLLNSHICCCNIGDLCFTCLLKFCLQFISEDQILISLGHFHPLVVTQSNLLINYISEIQIRFTKLLKAIECFRQTKNGISFEMKSYLINSKKLYNKYARICFVCFAQSNLISMTEFEIECIETNANTDKIWDTIFISGVIKMIQDIFAFECQIAALFNNEKLNEHLHLHEDSLAIFEGTSFILPGDSPYQSPLHESTPTSSVESNSDIKRENVCFSWNWRKILADSGHFTYLQKALQNNVQDVIKRSIQKENTALENGDWKDLVCTESSSPFLSDLIQMNSILHSVMDAITELERFLPVLNASSGAFVAFKSSFCHTVDTYIVDLLKHIENIARPKPDNFFIYLLYIAASNALLLQHRLDYYSSFFKDPLKPQDEFHLSNICHSTKQLADDIIEEIFHHNSKYLSCGILFDADSYNFNDQKPFYEGERVSYSVQMWNLYMKSLYADLKYFLPQIIAQELYARILSDSLNHFFIRYSHSNPSEIRTPQIFNDIMIILLCTSQLIYPACSSVSQIIGKVQENTDESVCEFNVNQIHSSCNYLLSVLVVLSAPISEVYKVFHNNFPQPRLSMRNKYESMAPWLPWLHKEWFTEFGKCLMLSNVSVWLAVKACVTWRIPNPTAIVQAYIEHDCTLSILLMTQASLIPDTSSESNIMIPYAAKVPKVKFAYSVLKTVLCYNRNYCFLSAILLPVIERSDGWLEFHHSSLNKKLSKRPWWYLGLLEVLKPYFDSIFKEYLTMWTEIQRISFSAETVQGFQKVKRLLKDFVICCCDANCMTPLKVDATVSEEVIAFLCVRKILSIMNRNLVMLPKALSYCLAELDEHVMNYVHHIEPVRQSVPLQVLFSTAISYLTEQLFIENQTPQNLKLCGMDKITADFLERFLIKPEETEMITAKHIKYLEVQVSLMKREFNNTKKDVDENKSSKENNHVHDEFLELSARELLLSSNGEDILLYLHQILCKNEVWIQMNLGIPEMLSSDHVLNSMYPSALHSRSTTQTPITSSTEELHSKTHKEKLLEAIDPMSNEEHQEETSTDAPLKLFTPLNLLEVHNLNQTVRASKYGLNLEPDINYTESKWEFNPLKHFDKLGDSNFFKVIADGFSLPWEALLSHLSILGLTELNFVMLLSQRWDIRNEGPVSEEDAKQIEELKNLYKI